MNGTNSPDGLFLTAILEIVPITLLALGSKVENLKGCWKGCTTLIKRDVSGAQRPWPPFLYFSDRVFYLPLNKAAKKWDLLCETLRLMELFSSAAP